MRKFLIAALAASAIIPTAVISTSASAQSAREVRQGQREVERDLRRGDYREAREDARELREDWRDYRRANRNVYRRSAYVGPRGYTYRPLNTGYRFRTPAYYGQRYWINDYGTYRLPAPRYRNQRWVRYGNDVLLVNVRSGAVVQVYRDFFWR